MSQYAINTRNEFFNLKTLTMSGVLALSVTSAFANNADNNVKKYVSSKVELVSNNSSFIGSSKDIKELSEEIIIKQTVSECSPYKVSKVVFSTIGKDEDLIRVIDVYTENISKDSNKLFEAEGTVLSSLPENYFVRYF
jgi:prolyl oligopeptidase PreP (S9A serine peptidase family)